MMGADRPRAAGATIATSDLTSAPGVGVPDVEPEHRWVLLTWLLVAAFALVTAVRSLQVDIPVRDPHGIWLTSRLAISAVLVVVLAVVDAWLRAGRGRPAAVLGVLRSRWTRRRTGLVLTGLLAYHLVYFLYHNLKSWDVLNTPRDRMLLDWDRWLFLGHSPAVLLHDLLDEHVAMYVLVVVYESFSTLVTLSFVSALVFPDRVRDGYVFITSALWIWILGVACYYAIPSLGPFDSAPEEFVGLPRTVVQETQARYMGQRANMLADPQAPDAFAQVSAFASLHVGVTTVLLLMARYYGMRRVTRVMYVYLLGTVLATVYLGWHFFVDDIAGVLIALLAVRLGRLMVYPPGHPSPPGRFEPAQRSSR